MEFRRNDPPGYLSITIVYQKLCDEQATEAVGRLQYFLASGQLQTFYFDRYLKIHELSADFWSNLYTDFELIFTESWISLEDPYEPNPIGDKAQVVIRQDDLIKIVENKAEPAPGDVPDVVGKSSGRPLRYDWPKIAGGFAWIIYQDGFAETKEEMIARLEEWCRGEFGDNGVPSRTSMQPVIDSFVEQKTKAEEIEKKSQ